MSDSREHAPGDPQFRIAGIAGSLRGASFNKALLRAARELAPARLGIEIHDLAAVPFYNQDVEDEGAPEAVTVLRQAVRNADAILIATPEYNHGIPGVLKNAIDWLSRPPRGNALNGKPAAIMGASSGLSGTARGQTQLRQALVHTNTYTMCHPEMLVRTARDKFDSSGHLTDESTRHALVHFLEEFVAWTSRFAVATKAQPHK